MVIGEAALEDGVEGVVGGAVGGALEGLLVVHQFVAQLLLPGQLLLGHFEKLHRLHLLLLQASPWQWAPPATPWWRAAPLGAGLLLAPSFFFSASFLRMSLGAA